MNRRGFIWSVVGLAAAPVAAALPVLPWVESAAPLGGEWMSLDAAMNAYVVFMHPDNAADLFRSLTPKEKWKLAYRAERLKLKGMTDGWKASGAIGSWEGVRFIES